MQICLTTPIDFSVGILSTVHSISNIPGHAVLDNGNGPLAVPDSQFVCVVRDDPAVGPYIRLFQYIAVDVLPVCIAISIYM